MSLPSGKKNIKRTPTTQQDAASGEQQTEVADQTTKRKETHQAGDAKSRSSRSSTMYFQRSTSTSSSAAKAYAKAKAAQAEVAFAAREAV